LAALSLRKGLLLAWRHNVDLLGCDDIGSVLRFVVLPRATVGRSVVPKIGIPVGLDQFPRKGEDAVQRRHKQVTRMTIFRKCEERSRRLVTVLYMPRYFVGYSTSERSHRSTF
jgi:hypothetical protein